MPVRALWVACGAAWMLGCTPPLPTMGSDSSTSSGLCGDLSTVPIVQISGFVQSTVDQSLVPDVQIALVETNWEPGTIHGTARSDATGHFTMTAGNITVLDDCWGLAVSYWLQGELNGWTGDKPLNPDLMLASETGDVEIALDFPLLMYPP